MHKLTMPEDCIGQRVKCPTCEADFEARPEATLALDAEPAKPAEAPKAVAPLPPLDGAYAETAGPRRVSRKERFCSDCGVKLSGTEDFCPGCGITLDELADRRRRRRPRWRDLPPLRGWLAVLSAILMPVGAILFIFALIVGDMPRRGPNRDLFIAVFCIFALAAELTALVFCLIWLYQAWRVVWHDDDDFSPGLRIGLLLVPVFNVYWMFVVIPGLSTAIQKELRSLAPNRAHNTGWVPGLIACILMLMPYFQPVGLCMFIAWMLLANHGLQRLIRYHERLRDEADRGEAER